MFIGFAKYNAYTIYFYKVYGNKIYEKEQFSVNCVMIFIYKIPMTSYQLLNAVLEFDSTMW